MSTPNPNAPSDWPPQRSAEIRGLCEAYIVVGGRATGLRLIGTDLPDAVREIEKLQALRALAVDLVQALEAKLADCRATGGCSDAALMEGEFCSDECAAMAEILARPEVQRLKEGK